jgi:hypothetical protein
MGRAGRTQKWNPPSWSENVIKRNPFEGLGKDERTGVTMGPEENDKTV